MLSVEGLFTTPYNRAQPTNGDLGTFESLGPLGSPAKTETTSGKSLREHLDSGPLIKDVRHRMKFVWYTRVSFTASSRERRIPRSCTCCRMQFPKSHQKGTLRDYRKTSERLQQQVQRQVLCCCVWASAWKCSDQHLEMLWPTPCTYLVDITSCFSTGFNTHHSQFLGFALTLLYRNLSTATRTNHRKEKPNRTKKRQFKNDKKRKLQGKKTKTKQLPTEATLVGEKNWTGCTKWKQPYSEFSFLAPELHLHCHLVITTGWMVSNLLFFVFPQRCAEAQADPVALSSFKRPSISACHRSNFLSGQGKVVSFNNSWIYALIPHSCLDQDYWHLHQTPKIGI